MTRMMLSFTFFFLGECPLCEATDLIASVAGQNIQIRSEMAPSIHHHYTSLGVTWRIGKHILIYENETSE